MIRKIILSLALCVFVSVVTFSQAKGNLSTTRLVDLEVTHLFAQKPPKVEVIFRAQENELDEPVWDLALEDLSIMEDSILCELTSLERISENRPINIALVIDHSGSMAQGLPNVQDVINWALNDPYVSPLEHAQSSAIEFASTFDYSKDRIGVIGFGHTVDINVAPSNDSSVVLGTIRNFAINGNTAYYDGLIAGINQLKDLDGINVIVSLTDGAENSSTNGIDDVIALSNKHGVPIYTIGLGLVEKEKLQWIADSTSGIFYHTYNPNKLTDIYQQVGKQIQAYYSLTYNSTALRKVKKQDVTIDFKTESPFLKNVPNDPDVIAYLERKEFEAQLWFYGKIAASVAVVAGLIILRYRRRRKKRLKQAES